MNKKNILILENLSENKKIIKKKLKKFNVIFKDFKNEIELKDFLTQRKKKKHIFAIYCSFGFLIDKNIFKNLNNTLKYIISPTTGLDHINLKDCKKYKIKVISLYKKENFLKNISSTAELTWGMILNLSRNISHFSNDVINKNNWNRNLFLGSDLNNKKLGIVGFGRIGRIVAKYGKAFGMSIYSNEINRKIKNKYCKQIKFISLKKLFKICDVVSIHIPLKGNYNLIKLNLLKRLSKNAILINTSRGDIFEENALISFIVRNKIKGIGLDVLPEDVKWKNKVSKKYNFIKKLKKNILILPHIGGNTLEAREKTSNFVLEQFLKELKV